MHTRSHKDFMNTDLTKDHFMRNRKGPIKIYTSSRMDLINRSFGQSSVYA